MTVSVVEVGTISTAGNASISSTPIAGDVVIAVYVSGRSTPRTVTSVAGLGAAWSSLYSTPDNRHQYWIGTGATTSGTITTTPSNPIDDPRIRTALLIRGLTANTVVGVGATTTGTSLSGTAQTAGLGQIVIASCTSTTATITYPSSQSPSGWTSQSVTVAAAASFGLTHRVPASSASHQTSATVPASAVLSIGSIVLGDLAAPSSIAAPLLTLTLDTLAPTIPTIVAAPLLTLTVDTLAPAVVVAAPVLALTLDTLAPVITTPPIAAPLLALTIDTLAPDLVVAAPLLSLTLDTLAPSVLGVVIDAPLLTLTIDTLAPEIPDGAESYTSAFGDVDAGSPITFTPDAGAESTTSAFGDATGPVTFESETIESTTFAWATAVADTNVILDDALGGPARSIKLVTRTGDVIATLENAVIGTASKVLGSRGGLDFTIGKNDPLLALCTQFAEVQLWRGANLVPGAWFVIVDPELSESATTVTMRCLGLRWYLERLIIGTDLPELLTNGGFEAGESTWNFGYDDGSVPAAPPLHGIVELNPLEGTKALRVAGADKSQLIKKTIESLAIFVPNEATFLAGGEQRIRDEVQDILENSAVTVEGHTADADGGTGLALSIARANAAKAVIEDERPDLTVTAVGKGETEPVDPRHTEAAYKKNRRIVIIATTVQEATGHRQYAWKRFRFTNPLAARIACELDLTAWANLVLFRGPSKDGWLVYIERRLPADRTKLLDEGHQDIAEDFPLEAWSNAHAQVKAPADGIEYEYEVRLYPTAGETWFDDVSVKPNLRTGWWHADIATALAGLVEHAQDPAFGKSDLNIETLMPPTGVVDDFSYEWARGTKVDSAIAEITARDDAPDFEIDVTATRRVARTYAPRKGRLTGITFGLGDRAPGSPRILKYATGVDGDQVTTAAIMQSTFTGGGMVQVIVRTLPRADGLVLERLVQAEQDVPAATLRAQGRSIVKYGEADIITRVIMDPAWTSWLQENVDTGDVVTLDIFDTPTEVLAPYRLMAAHYDSDRDQMAYDVATEEPGRTFPRSLPTRRVDSLDAARRETTRESERLDRKRFRPPPAIPFVQVVPEPVENWPTGQAWLDTSEPTP